MVFASTFRLPLTAELCPRRDSVQRWFQRLAKSTADKILSELANNCPDLTAIVIEIKEDRGRDPNTGRWPESASASYAFIRSKQTDLYGCTAIVGMAVETHMVKHYEPCSDVLDLVGAYPSER